MVAEEEEEEGGVASLFLTSSHPFKRAAIARPDRRPATCGPHGSLGRLDQSGPNSNIDYSNECGGTVTSTDDDEAACAVARLELACAACYRSTRESVERTEYSARMEAHCASNLAAVWRSLTASYKDDSFANSPAIAMAWAG
eukprot:scaffold549_cov385-Prasinococcus_capsulatus_cf.AAC.15